MKMVQFIVTNWLGHLKVCLKIFTGRMKPRNRFICKVAILVEYVCIYGLIDFELSGRP